MGGARLLRVDAAFPPSFLPFPLSHCRQHAASSRNFLEESGFNSLALTRDLVVTTLLWQTRLRMIKEVYRNNGQGQDWEGGGIEDTSFFSSIVIGLQTVGGAQSAHRGPRHSLTSTTAHA